MSKLKEVVINCGSCNVDTYIQSGNVIFESEEKSIEKITRKLEGILSKNFDYTVRIAIRSYLQLKKIVSEVPPEWNKRDDIRCYIAFIKKPVAPKTMVKEIMLKERIDFVK